MTDHNRAVVIYISACEGFVPQDVLTARHELTYLPQSETEEG